MLRSRRRRRLRRITQKRADKCPLSSASVTCPTVQNLTEKKSWSPHVVLVTPPTSPSEEEHLHTTVGLNSILDNGALGCMTYLLFAF